MFHKSQEEVIKNWQGNQPAVSICCITYNHESYIEEALNGFLIQETNFPFEIVIHDDASTDNTARIIKKYEKKYPAIFRPIYQTENQKSKYKSGMNPRFNFPRAKGKYLALCDGDDYWSDPYKLQKQVDFLEEHEEYGVVHGDCHFYYQKDKRWKHNANKDLSNNIEIRNKEELFYRLVNADYKIRTATVLFRKSLWEQRTPKVTNFLMGDTPMWLDFSQVTQFKYFDEVYAVYRLNEGSVTRQKSLHSKLKFQLSGCMMRFYYSEKYNYKVSNKIIKKYNRLLLDYSLLSNDIESFQHENYINDISKQKIKSNLMSPFFIKIIKFCLKHPKLALRQLKLERN